MFITASVHASTDFYFLLPGLLLWLLDWCWRLFQGDAGGLQKKVTGMLESAEGGWYRLTLPVSARPSKASAADPSDVEKLSYDTHPLQTYYLNIPSISKLQNHAFTAAKIGTETAGPTFLFQRAQPKSAKTKQKKLDKQWTWKLGATAQANRTSAINDEDPVPATPTEVQLHVEGPYIPREATVYVSAQRVVCIVGGTGVTGANSLALWWLENRTKEPHARFLLIWTVRHRETANLREWQDLEQRMMSAENMQLRLHISSENGRLDVEDALRAEFSSAIPNSGQAETGGKAWVYVSGPAGLLSKAENASVDLKRELRDARRRGRKAERPLVITEMEHYVAKWEV